MQERLPDRSSSTLSVKRSAREPAFPNAKFEGIAWRRILAFFFDIMILLAIFISLLILNVATFFVISGLLTFLWPAFLFVLYDTLLIGGQGSATIGMRLMGLKIVNQEGSEPGYLQALILSILFYFSITFTSGLILLIALCNNRGRCLHDILTGVFIINTDRSSAKLK